GVGEDVGLERARPLVAAGVERDDVDLVAGDAGILDRAGQARRVRLRGLEGVGVGRPQPAVGGRARAGPLVEAAVAAAALQLEAGVERDRRPRRLPPPGPDPRHPVLPPPRPPPPLPPPPPPPP